MHDVRVFRKGNFPSSCTFLNLSRSHFARSIHERPSPDYTQSAVAGHMRYTAHASGTIPFSDFCRRVDSRFACAYGVTYSARAETSADILGLRMNLPYRAVSKHLGAMGE